jgi:hypothetical protein
VLSLSKQSVRGVAVARRTLVLSLSKQQEAKMKFQNLVLSLSKQKSLSSPALVLSLSKH